MNENIYIELKQKIEIPKGVVSDIFNKKNPTFNAPWSHIPKGFPRSLLDCENESVNMTSGEEVLKIKYKNQSIYLNRRGVVFLKIHDQFDGNKTIELLKKIPLLFEWGFQIRKEQNDILEKVRALLPGWKISALTEYERHYVKRESLKKVEDLLKRFNDSKEIIPAGFQGNIIEAIKRLEEDWGNTVTTKTAVQKQMIKDEEENEEFYRMAENELLQKKNEMIEKLRKAGLV